jgi:hypothetical protein
MPKRMVEALLISEGERLRVREKAGRWTERFNWERHAREFGKVLVSSSNVNQLLTNS